MDEIASAKNPTNNHNILARLPIRTYWTTNYDKLIEKSLESNGKIVDVKYTNNHLALTKKRRDAVIYKMHGDIDHPDTAILTKDDYEKYSVKNAPYITALSGDLVSKTFLFLGFSFTDPNLDYIMSRVRAYFEDHQRQHYCIFKECSVNDFENVEEFQNAVIKQKLLVKDLQRFRVKTLLVEKYEDITLILKKIDNLYRRKTVFLSGSAHEFGEWKKEDVESFLCKLGSVLIEKNYKLSSGIGLGIGNAFITGAIQSVYSYHNGKVDEYINMKPFPQYIEDESLRKQTWKKYRYEIVGSAGIALFFMGNKLVNGAISVADGMEEEFQIARELGLIVIPIGCSGYKSKELWERVNGDINKYFQERSSDFIDALATLGEPVEKPEQLISKVVRVLDLISKE